MAALHSYSQIRVRTMVAPSRPGRHRIGWELVPIPAAVSLSDSEVTTSMTAPHSEDGNVGGGIVLGQLPDNALVTGHAGHQIYMVRSGVAHWVPDTWTMCSHGLSPRQLLVMADWELEELLFGPDLLTAVPTPVLADGTIVETESGIWQASAGRLSYVADPRDVREAVYDNSRSVVWLPDSIVRGACERPDVSLHRRARIDTARLGESSP